MKSRTEIRPERVTKPIQLLAAWLVGLILVDGCFLVAAVNLEQGTLERLVLVLASAFNVPLFLGALFLLQTRFRPELQEDSYYSKYLDRKTNAVVRVSKEQALVHAISRAEEVLHAETASPMLREGPGEGTLLQAARVHIALNRRLADFAGIRARLKESGVRLESLFGGSSEPPLRLVAIAEDVPFDVKLAVLSLAIDLKFEAYTPFDRFLEQTEEQVLLGSYGREGIRIAPELKPLLDSKPDPIDLELYEEAHAIVRPEAAGSSPAV